MKYAVLIQYPNDTKTFVVLDEEHIQKVAQQALNEYARVKIIPYKIENYKFDLAYPYFD